MSCGNVYLCGSAGAAGRQRVAVEQQLARGGAGGGLARRGLRAALLGAGVPRARRRALDHCAQYTGYLSLQLHHHLTTSHSDYAIDHVAHIFEFLRRSVQASQCFPSVRR